MSSPLDKRPAAAGLFFGSAGSTPLRVLGIETSCDETGVALFDTQAGLLAEALHSQGALHTVYGGVVPELASRDHILRILPLAREVLAVAGKRWNDLDAIAYTAGPGLAGALLAGASVANGLACGLGIPALPIHHLEGHLLSPLLSPEPPEFPFVALLVSGGHTQLMSVAGVGRYEMMGATLDDAAGEAFDKTAQLLGLDYPGGPALAALADRGVRGRYRLPRPLLADPALDFSFAGLKTAVLTAVTSAARSAGRPLSDQDRADLAAEFQQAVVEVLVAKSLAALEQAGSARLVVAGGVGANRALRATLAATAAREGFRVYFPAPELCTDNGAMIALAGALRLQAQATRATTEGALGAGPGSAAAGYGFAVKPRWPLQAG
jgi:N6-L-threonylcarbamoyladenine synthase